MNVTNATNQKETVFGFRSPQSFYLQIIGKEFFDNRNTNVKRNNYMNVLKKIRAHLLPIAFIFACATYLGCGDKTETQVEREARWAEGKLNSFEYEHGIGPVTEVPELGPVDLAMAEKGKQHFIQKCATCHYLDFKKTGPPLRDVAKRRSAAYILNQVQNPEQMGKLHPDGKKLVAQYMQYMTIQGITPEIARELLEFLRSEAERPAVAEQEQPGFGTPPPPPDSATVK
jgi:cytochrome c551/c552